MTSRTERNPHGLSPEELATYREQGFLVRRGVVPEEARQPVIEAMKRAVDKMANAWLADGFISSLHEDLPFETRWAVLRSQVPPKSPVSWRRILVSRGVYDLWQRPEILGPVRSIVGDEVYAHGIWNGRPREPHTTSTQKINWHQDAHYYKRWDEGDGALVSCWMPLVPVDEESGCLQFSPRSNHRGYIDRTRDANNLFTINESELDTDPVSVPCEPGDLILFSDLTLHQALGNVSDRVRWSIDIRYGSATEAIIDKSSTGYYCYSASDPSRVESYETWAARYDYTMEELMEELETRAPSAGPIDLDALAKQLGISRVELEVF